MLEPNLGLMVSVFQLDLCFLQKINLQFDPVLSLGSLGQKINL